jgi:hypothetical protein
MRPACLTTLSLALLVLAHRPAEAQSPSPTGGQNQTLSLPGRADAPVPDRVSSLIVEGHLSEVAGTYVLMSAARVETVVSPRAFSVRQPLFLDRQTPERARPLVLLSSPLPALARGTTLEVTGWVVTLATATRVLGRDWAGSVDDEFFAHPNRPVVIANVVRALDGAELFSRP